MVALGPDAAGVTAGRAARDLSLDRLRHLRRLPRAATSISATARARSASSGRAASPITCWCRIRAICCRWGGSRPAQAAPYACSGLTAFSALKRVGEAVYRNQPILVIGAGGLGLMALALLKALGGKGAVVADIDPKKREAALAAGAMAAVDAGAADAVKQAQAAAKAPLGAAIDFVGAGPTARLGIDAVTRGGKYVIVGLFGGDITLALPLLPIRAITIQGSFVGSLGEFKELMALVEAGAVPPVPMQARQLHDCEAALAELRAGRIVGRAILTP